MSLLTERTAWVSRPAGVVAVTGPDRLTYLHTLFTQHLADATPGAVADFLYLDAKGGPLAEGRSVVRAADVLLVTPPQVAGDLVDALARYTFLLQVQAADLSGDWSVASVRGPGPVAVPGARSELMTAAPQGEGMIVRDRSGGVDLVGPTAWVARRTADLGFPQASLQDFDTWRIHAGVPSWGSEIAAGRRTQELGLLPTHVHLRKGCYPGQESIAKIYNLGRPRRALAVTSFAGPVAAGDPVEAGAKRGEITSVAPTGEGSVALALLPVDREGRLPHGLLHVGGISGRVVRRVGDGPIPGA